MRRKDDGAMTFGYVNAALLLERWICDAQSLEPAPMKTMAKSHRITHHDIPPKELGIKTWKVAMSVMFSPNID